MDSDAYGVFYHRIRGDGLNLRYEYMITDHIDRFFGASQKKPRKSISESTIESLSQYNSINEPIIELLSHYKSSSESINAVGMAVYCMNFSALVVGKMQVSTPKLVVNLSVLIENIRRDFPGEKEQIGKGRLVDSLLDRKKEAR